MLFENITLTMKINGESNFNILPLNWGNFNNDSIIKLANFDLIIGILSYNILKDLIYSTILNFSKIY
jgi:hypothetical protein